MEILKKKKNKHKKCKQCYEVLPLSLFPTKQKNYIVERIDICKSCFRDMTDTFFL